ncbi:MAG: formylglycine-generating enzyme family protein [Methylococcales bacterium]|nr:formylglycine-generating enzyme family protein [Methylococcales bacterium]
MPPVASGTKILILSDLGALSVSPSAARHWQRFARGFRKAGVQLVAWVPHSARQVEKDTAQCITIHCLDRQGNLRRQAGRLQTARQRLAEHQRLHQLREQLLTRLSFCVRVEKALLRAGRELHPATAAEPALEGLIWSYRPVVRASDISRPLTPAYQGHYRARFSNLTFAEQQTALNCVLHLHSWQGRSTGVLETLIWESYVGGAADGDAVKPVVESAKAWISAFRATQVVESGSREVIVFAEDLLSRNWQDEIFQRRYSEWLAELWAFSGQTEVPPGLEAADVAKVGQESIDGALQAYRLMAIGIELMLWPVAMSTPACAVSAINSPWTLEGLELISESPRSRRWLMPKGKPMPLLERADVASCVLIAGGRRYAMTQLQRPAWASKFGRDRLGIFAEMVLSTAQGSAKQFLRWIEPGTFRMGSPDDEPERGGNEGPQHEVTLSRGFWLADTACTQAMWQAVMGNNPSHFQDDPQQPVEQVSWHAVGEFLQRLQALLPGCQVDLPSEAEWEYACRAGTTTPFSFGPQITPQQVNYAGSNPYAGGEQGEYRQKTVAVKSLPANPWGLYEMHGNVYEWCKDGQRTYDRQAQVDPLEPLTSEQEPRSVRGGSWIILARWARSAYRYAYLPGYAYDYLGFRFCLRSIETGQETGVPGGTPGRATGGSPKSVEEDKSPEQSFLTKMGSFFTGHKPKG